MDLTRRVKDLVLSNNLDYVGIASVESLRNEPQGRRPTDFLPGAQTVVSFGVRLSLGVQLTNKMAHHVGPRELIFPYLWHGFGLPSLHYLDRTALLVTRLLEKEGHIAVPVTAVSPFDIRSSLMEFSNINAAVAAGLGELGWSGLLLTPDVGPRARFGSVITTAKLETDPMYRGPKLCDPVKCKESGHSPPCAAVCPTSAIGPEIEAVVIGNRSFEVARVKRYHCMWASMGLTRDALGLKDIPMPDKVEAKDIVKAMGEREHSQSLELMVISRGDYCGKCIMECPAGSPARVEEKLLEATRRRPPEE